MAEKSPMTRVIEGSANSIDILGSRLARSAQQVGRVVSIIVGLLSLGVAVAQFVGVFGSADGAEVSTDQVFWDKDSDQLVDCVFVVNPALATPYCDEPGLMAGKALVTYDRDDGNFGFDVDEDGQLELVCNRTFISTPAEPEGRFEAASCVPSDDSGPSSDRFLLTDGSTAVERIDVNGNGRADFVVIGNSDPIALPQPLPWYRAILPGVLVAIVGGFFSVAVVWLTQRTPTKPNGAQHRG